MYHRCRALRLPYVGPEPNLCASGPSSKRQLRVLAARLPWPARSSSTCAAAASPGARSASTTGAAAAAAAVARGPRGLGRASSALPPPLGGSRPSQLRNCPGGRGGGGARAPRRQLLPARAGLLGDTAASAVANAGWLNLRSFLLGALLALAAQLLARRLLRTTWVRAAALRALRWLRLGPGQSWGEWAGPAILVGPYGYDDEVYSQTEETESAANGDADVDTEGEADGDAEVETAGSADESDGGDGPAAGGWGVGGGGGGGGGRPLRRRRRRWASKEDRARQREQDILARMIANDEGETVEWVNMCIRKSWRVFQRGLERWLTDLLQPVFDGLLEAGTMPQLVQRLRIVEFTLDHEAPYVSNMRRRNSRKDSDLNGVVNVRYTGGARMLLALEIGEGRWRFKVPVLVSELDLECALWLKVRLAPMCPWIGTISLAFVGPPAVKVQLSPYNRVRLMRIPVLQSFLTKLLTVDLPQLMVLPKRLEISIPPSVTSIAEAAVGRDTIMRAVASAVLQVDSLEQALLAALPLGPQTPAGGVTLPDSFQGELTVSLREARDLPVWGFPWQSNPYCMIVLGEQAVRSRRDNDTSQTSRHRAPVWNQEVQFLAQDKDKQVLEVYVKDSHMTGRTNLGKATYPLRDLPPSGAASVWLPLLDDSGGRLGEGELLVDISYKPFVDDEQDSGYREAEAFARTMQLQTDDIRDIRSAAAASSRAAVAASAAISAIAMTKAAAARAAARAAQAAKSARAAALGVAAQQVADEAAAGGGRGPSSSSLSSSPISSVESTTGRGWDSVSSVGSSNGNGGPPAGNGVGGNGNGASALQVGQLPADTAAARIAAAALAEVEDLEASDESLRSFSEEGESDDQRRWRAEVAAQQIRDRTDRMEAAVAQLVASGQADARLQEGMAKAQLAAAQAIAALQEAATGGATGAAPGGGGARGGGNGAAAAAAGAAAAEAATSAAIAAADEVSARLGIDAPAAAADGGPLVMPGSVVRVYHDSGNVISEIMTSESLVTAAAEERAGGPEYAPQLVFDAGQEAAPATGMVLDSREAAADGSSVNGSPNAAVELPQQQLQQQQEEEQQEEEEEQQEEKQEQEQQQHNDRQLGSDKTGEGQSGSQEQRQQEPEAAGDRGWAGALSWLPNQRQKDGKSSSKQEQQEPGWWDQVVQSDFIRRLRGGADGDASGKRKQQGEEDGQQQQQKQQRPPPRQQQQQQNQQGPPERPWWAGLPLPWPPPQGTKDGTKQRRKERQRLGGVAAESGEDSAAEDGSRPVEAIVIPPDLPLEEIALEVARLKEESWRSKEDHVETLWARAVEQNDRSWLMLLAFLLTVTVCLLAVVAWRLQRISEGDGGGAPGGPEELLPAPLDAPAALVGLVAALVYLVSSGGL